MENKFGRRTAASLDRKNCGFSNQKNLFVHLTNNKAMNTEQTSLIVLVRQT